MAKKNLTGIGSLVSLLTASLGLGSAGLGVALESWRAPLLLLGTLFWGISLWLVLKHEASRSTRGITAIAGLALILAWAVPVLPLSPPTDPRTSEPEGQYSQRLVIHISGMT